MIWKTTNELTKRERDVLPLLALPYKEIAKRLGVTKSTVRCHIANLSYKFPEQPNKLFGMKNPLLYWQILKNQKLRKNGLL